MLPPHLSAGFYAIGKALLENFDNGFDRHAAKLPASSSLRPAAEKSNGDQYKRINGISAGLVKSCQIRRSAPATPWPVAELHLQGKPSGQQSLCCILTVIDLR
jgi:hypothetical protein